MTGRALSRLAFRALVTAAVAALFVGLLAAASLYLREVAFGDRVAHVLAVLVLGTALGAFAADVAAELVGAGRSPVKRFAACLAALPVGCVCGIEFVYLLDFTRALASLGPASLSQGWLLAVGFAGATTLFTLFAAGLPLLMPWALPALIVAAWRFAVRTRR